jgi:NAD(P)-dependent dehydrogenase (short-subunit alcohol dehydrogenase family)
MSHPSPPHGHRVLIVGSQGVLGSLLADVFSAAGWDVVRGGRRPDERPDFRHVDLDAPATVAAAIADTEIVINAVPDHNLTAERMVLDHGGILINVSAMSVEPGRRLRRETSKAHGTVVMGAGIAPGLTNLIAADLLSAHPEADEVELAFTVSTKSTSGPAGGDFAHRNLCTVGRHRTAVIPLPEPFGVRRCIGFAESDAGWLGTVAAAREVSPYVCLAERSTHRLMLAMNKAGLLSRLPRAAFGSRVTSSNRREPASQETVVHWIAVHKVGERIAARTLECRGDYRSAARCTAVFAHALLDDTGAVHPGVFDPEDVLCLEHIAPALRDRGITVVDHSLTASAARPTRRQAEVVR